MVNQTASEPLIELRNVSKSFGKNKVLDQANLKINQEDALAIIGPSGTGKSTILRIIAGLEAPDEGEIFINGQKREGLIEDAPSPIKIGMVFQQSALFDSLTVEENVGFLLSQHSRLKEDEIRKLVEENLKMVGLKPEDVAHLYPGALSGGMRKRVSLARSIIVDPKRPEDNLDVILYDEPTAGLDPIASTIIEDLVRKLREEKAGGSTYVMVTHQQSTIQRTADRVVFLYEGQVQWDGRVTEVATTDNRLVRQFFTGSTEGPIEMTR